MESGDYVGKKIEKVKDTKVGLKLHIIFIETNTDLYSKNNKKVENFATIFVANPH